MELQVQDPQQVQRLDEIRCDEMVKLLEDFYNIQEIQHSLSSIIENQSGMLDTIEHNMENTKQHEINGLQELKIAQQYSFRYSPVIIGSLLGVSLMGPTGIFFGLKMGSIATGIGGACIGGWCGYKIQK